MARLGQRDGSDTRGRQLAVALQPHHQLSRLRSGAGGLALPQEDSRGK